jgi:hypothetical protein
MSYRRKQPDYAAEREWRSWVDKNTETLDTLGLPSGIYSSRSAWGDFLSTGSAVFRVGREYREFDFNTMTIEQQKGLHRFLERELGMQQPTSSLLRFLRVRASYDWTPPFY